ncbi:MAG: sugar phosphorylase [Planctomycetes bacterium]|nr:sugar phosphorylase [Planctomycetota bacterium]
MDTVSFDLNRIRLRLERLYGERASEAAEAVWAAIERVDLSSAKTSDDNRWNERDVVLITYGDQLRSDSLNPLQTLHHFLNDWDLPRLINTVHFLPCFPSTSDDGFSVVDYRQIDPKLGSWDDVHAIGQDCRLMLDLVLNHISQASEWFQKYLAGEAPYDRFFIEVDPEDDLSAVTRPRSLPLLSEFETSRGQRWLWTTFSRDQLDLNYAEPACLAEMLGILLEYVARGARIIRLDAIAYLWKRIGTDCIHLDETHEVVKLMREVLEQVAPQTLLLTETNVPHEENVSYFGEGDEADMVYQFSLPPLLLDAFLNEDAVPLKSWLEKLQSPPPGATYFNFTASHDGVGVRPLEGHVDDERLRRMVDKVRALGGAIGTRRQADGTDTPYEMNVSFLSALAPEDGNLENHARRFLTTQAVMLALQGVPAVYFHSLVGTENDLEGMRASGIPRRINRRKFSLTELNERLNSEGTLAPRVFLGFRELLAIRTRQSAFHPDAQQHYQESNSEHVLCFERKNQQTGQSILVAANFGAETTVIDLPAEYCTAIDLLDPAKTIPGEKLSLMPAQIVWLEARLGSTKGTDFG